MGRHSRSPRSSRRRSSSRSPSRRRDRSRDRSRTEDSRKESNLRGIENAKKRMRDALKAADSSTTSTNSPTCAPRPFDDLSVSEQASRAREIERIDEGGFQPSQFKSTAGGAGGRVYNQKKSVSKAERVGTAQEEHEKAIFGPTWMDKKLNKAAVEKKELGIPLPKTSLPTGPSLLHPSFLEEPEVRKEKWLSLWRQQRQIHGVL